jgi:hypothetical protein
VFPFIFSLLYGNCGIYTFLYRTCSCLRIGKGRATEYLQNSLHLWLTFVYAVSTFLSLDFCEVMEKNRVGAENVRLYTGAPKGMCSLLNTVVLRETD